MIANYGDNQQNNVGVQEPQIRLGSEVIAISGSTMTLGLIITRGS